MIYKKIISSPQYYEVLEKAQAEANNQFWQINSSEVTEETKSLLNSFYKKFIDDNSVEIAGYTKEEIIEKLFNDTHNYSVLTDPLNDPDVEGININSWNCIILQFKNGKYLRINGFENSEHAINIMRRLIQSKGGVLDDAMPIIETSIGSNIRITTVKTPIVDEDIGVSCYIRKLSKTTFKKEQYIDSGFCTNKELDLLTTFMRRGVSVLVVGKVNTGKTTFLSYLLSTLSNNTKVVTIENSAREMNLVKIEEGIIKNNVVHMLTRENKNKDYNIDQEDLVVISLRLNPDYISVAEMRDREASAAVEASKSGHPIISTTHAGSPREAHNRIADLSRKGNNTDYATALLQAQQAFPVVVFLHTLEDNTRRIMGITECYTDDENKAHYNPLWKYEIEENKTENNVTTIMGSHRQIGKPSDILIEKMQMYGISKQEIENLKG